MVNKKSKEYAKHLSVGSGGGINDMLAASRSASVSIGGAMDDNTHHTNNSTVSGVVQGSVRDQEVWYSQIIFFCFGFVFCVLCFFCLFFVCQWRVSKVFCVAFCYLYVCVCMYV